MCLPSVSGKPVSGIETNDEMAELASDQLQSHLSAKDIDLTLNIIREQRARGAKLPEAQLLADALALEDFGLVGLWNQLRQFHATGRTLDQLIKLLKNQHEYGYWEARLRDGIYFDVTRNTARRRLEEMTAFAQAI